MVAQVNYSPYAHWGTEKGGSGGGGSFRSMTENVAIEKAFFLFFLFSIAVVCILKNFEKKIGRRWENFNAD